MKKVFDTYIFRAEIVSLKKIDAKIYQSQKKCSAIIIIITKNKKELVKKKLYSNLIWLKNRIVVKNKID